MARSRSPGSARRATGSSTNSSRLSGCAGGRSDPRVTIKCGGCDCVTSPACILDSHARLHRHDGHRVPQCLRLEPPEHPRRSMHHEVLQVAGSHEHSSHEAGAHAAAPSHFGRAFAIGFARNPSYVCQSALGWGSDAILVQLRLFCADQSGLKQIDFPSTVHLTSDELEARDLTFSLSVGPWQSDCCSNRRFIFRDAAGERSDETGAGALDPRDEARLGRFGPWPFKTRSIKTRRLRPPTSYS